MSIGQTEAENVNGKKKINMERKWLLGLFPLVYNRILIKLDFQ